MLCRLLYILCLFTCLFTYIYIYIYIYIYTHKRCPHIYIYIYGYIRRPLFRGCHQAAKRIVQSNNYLSFSYYQLISQLLVLMGSLSVTYSHAHTTHTCLDKKVNLNIAHMSHFWDLVACRARGLMAPLPPD